MGLPIEPQYECRDVPLVQCGMLKYVPSCLGTFQWTAWEQLGYPIGPMGHPTGPQYECRNISLVQMWDIPTCPQVIWDFPAFPKLPWYIPLDHLGNGWVIHKTNVGHLYLLKRRVCIRIIVPLIMVK